jgi:hypothetical protein
MSPSVSARAHSDAGGRAVDQKLLTQAIRSPAAFFAAHEGGLTEGAA